MTSEAPKGRKPSAGRKVGGKFVFDTAPPADGSPRLLSGGNPQIDRGDGDGPVQAYIAAMPGWKSAVGAELDALITRELPTVEKVIRWNSPFYGMPGQGWFISYHCFTRYIKVTFLFGRALQPMPPEASKDPNARYVHLVEDRPMDAAQMADWIRQASQGESWKP